MERLVVIILGPTASGKTAASIELAKKIDTEIISADSRQIFKFLDIGTAKPESWELKTVKHHFIDEIKPDEEFNANIFETRSLKIIEDLLAKGKTPIVAGGSGLYIQALVDGIFDVTDTDEELRNEFLKLKAEKGIEYLYFELQKVDPVSSKKMLPQNWKRVIRALEIYRLTGKPIWQVQAEYKRNVDVKFIQFGLKWDRDILYERINARTELMIQNGLVEETKKIISLGYNKDLNSLNTVGYKEIFSFLEGEFSLEKSIELIKRNTRRFAKRQMTWFRRDKRINWLELKKEEDLLKVSDKIFEQLKK